MDFASLAAMTVNLLIPYLAKAGGTIAKGVTSAAWEKTQEIYASIQKKLAGDPYAAQTLKRLEGEPASVNRQAAMAGVLEEKLKEDAAFAGVLQKLLEEAKALGGETITQQVSISGNAHTGDIQVIGKVEGGNVTMGKKP